MHFVFLQRNIYSHHQVEQSEFYEIIDNLSIFSGEGEKYHYAVKFIAILSMYDTKQIS